MANKVPSPTLDTRSGDLIVAQAISSLPAELSDRSDSNPAVVIIEAVGAIFDKDNFAINQFPSAVIQKCLALVGVNLLPASAATVTQQFTLSQPQVSDTTIPKGTLSSTADGSLSFSTLSDVTVRAYTSPAGTISLTSGSTAVVGSGTTFTTDAPAGYQISVDKNTWYTVASVTNDTNLVLTASAGSTVSGSSYFSGAITATVSAQATTTGNSTNAAAGALNTLQSSPNAVASTINPAVASLGSDQETTTAAIARAPSAFTSRDTACSASDYATFAQVILGTNGRAAALANTNVTTAATGFVTVAMLSPAWTTSSSVSAQERANVIRDLSGRTFTGATTVDVAANIQQFTSTPNLPAALVFRSSSIDAATCQVNIAKAINSYLTPNTYSWGRTIYATDLEKVVQSANGVDRVLNILGTVAVGTTWQQPANNMTLTNGSAAVTANAADVLNMKVYQTFIVDSINGAGYLVIAASGTSITLDRAFAGNTTTSKPFFFHGADTTLTNWFTLPYCSLSVDPTNPPASIVVVGGV